MYKKIILVALFLVAIISITQIKVKAISSYNQEEIIICPTLDEVERNPDLLEKFGCASGSGLFTEGELNTAIIFLKKIKYSIRQNDMEYFVNTVTYPLEIGNLKINNQEELYIRNYNLSKICAIQPEEKLFWNYLGFVYGNLRFYVKDNKIIELKIFTD